MFEWLENTPLALWVGESVWAYPLLLSLHVIGMAAVAGLFSLRDLRLLGLFPGIAPASFLAVGRLAWIGFAINAVSGSLLFTSQAAMFVDSTPFLIKIGCITLGVTLAAVIQARLRTTPALADGSLGASGTTKILAAISLLAWLAAIASGRLIAYL